MIVAERSQPLTPRETVVLNLVAAGMSNRAIADTIYVQVATVKMHVSQLYQKLGGSTRVDLVTRGVHAGLIACPYCGTEDALQRQV